jgi:hypothetical protein
VALVLSADDAMAKASERTIDLRLHVPSPSQLGYSPADVAG